MFDICSSTFSPDEKSAGRLARRGREDLLIIFITLIWVPFLLTYCQVCPTTCASFGTGSVSTNLTEETLILKSE